MLKKFVLVSMLVLVALTASGCTINVVRGSGKVISNSRSVSGFDSLLFAGIGELIITQGATESLKIDAEDNIMPKIITRVEKGQLYIGFERENWQDQVFPTKSIVFNLTVKNLKSVELSGVGSVNTSAFKANDLAIKVGGAGGVKMKGLDIGTITTTLSGAGNVELFGKAGRVEVSLSGVGNFSCGDLQVSTAKVTVSGAGGATVWAVENLEINITGAGSVGYYGKPRLIKNITGLGVINELGNK
jgi:predicted small secreted protein